jgi:hypothetical protein
VTTQGGIDYRLRLHNLKVVIAIEFLNDMEDDIGDGVGLSHAKLCVDRWAEISEATANTSPDRTLRKRFLFFDLRYYVFCNASVGCDCAVEEAFDIVNA